MWRQYELVLSKEKKKKRFLISLLKALGFGSVIAYSICSCDTNSKTNRQDSQIVPETKTIEFQPNEEQEMKSVEFSKVMQSAPTKIEPKNRATKYLARPVTFDELIR